MKLSTKISPALINSTTSVVMAILMATSAYASGSGCSDAPINPVTDVCWECMYPFKIGGVSILDDNQYKDTVDSGVPDSPICTCPQVAPPFVKIGITFSFWEPARLVETVKSPYCFPSMGQEISNPNPGKLAGASAENTTVDTGTVFAQAHYYIFPAMALISTAINKKCGSSGESSNLDLAYMTEVDASWNDEMTNLLMMPETLLFMNPYTVYACAVDALTVNVGDLALDLLFWCMGSQGPVYPVCGHMNMNDYIDGNFGLAQKMIYKMARSWLICDPAMDLCNCVSVPMWAKDHYRYQLAKPVKGSSCYYGGQSGILWGSGKNPPYSANGNKTDNFLWVIFRKHDCCVSYSK